MSPPVEGVLTHTALREVKLTASLEDLCSSVGPLMDPVRALKAKARSRSGYHNNNSRRYRMMCELPRCVVLLGIGNPEVTTAPNGQCWVF